MDNQDIQKSVTELREEIAEIKEILKPISDTYRTATTIGSWTKGLLVFISVSLGVIMGMRDIFKK